MFFSSFIKDSANPQSALFNPVKLNPSKVAYNVDILLPNCSLCNEDCSQVFFLHPVFPLIPDFPNKLLESLLPSLLGSLVNFRFLDRALSSTISETFWRSVFFTVLHWCLRVIKYSATLWCWLVVWDLTHSRNCSIHSVESTLRLLYRFIGNARVGRSNKGILIV